MCPDRDEFSFLGSLTDPIMITIADGSEVEAQGVGTVRVQLKTGEVNRIEETLWVPGLDRRLLSISALSKKGLQVIFPDLSCQIKNNTEVVAHIPRRNKMYVLECSPAEVANVCEETNQEQKSGEGSGAADLQVWHARLGHLSTKILKAAYYIENKSEVTDRFIEYKDNQLSKKIKCIRTDNGTEYVNRRFSGVCRKSGIMHQTTVPYSPQQNGLAERVNRTLTEQAKAMLSHMQMDKIWWAEAMNKAVYVTNRVPCASQPTTTPFEFIFGKGPDLSEMRVFGSKGYAHFDKSNRTKMTKKASRCIFLDSMRGHHLSTCNITADPVTKKFALFKMKTLFLSI
ncbi:unnamed protein product [Peronospora effusa]|nr:unnamed protein product [Peronospora effusa]